MRRAPLWKAPGRREFARGGSGTSSRGADESYSTRSFQMRSRMYLALAAMAAVPATLSAQANSCANTVTQDACQKAVDLFQYMAPQLGTVIAGGNATLGQGGTLGGFATFPFPHPKFSIGFRVNALQGSLPDDENAAATPVPGDRVSSTIPVKDQ